MGWAVFQSLRWNSNKTSLGNNCNYIPKNEKLNPVNQKRLQIVKMMMIPTMILMVMIVIILLLATIISSYTDKIIQRHSRLQLISRQHKICSNQPDFWIFKISQLEVLIKIFRSIINHCFHELSTSDNILISKLGQWILNIP